MLGHTLYAKQLNLEPRWTRQNTRGTSRGDGLFGMVLRMLVSASVVNGRG